MKSFHSETRIRKDWLYLTVRPRGRSCVIDLLFIFVLHNYIINAIFGKFFEKQTFISPRGITQLRNCSFSLAFLKMPGVIS
jgi:hypothetical protein